MAASNDKTSEQPASDWLSRKRALYADLGEDLPDDLMQKGTAELASLQESLHDSIESIEEVEDDNIDDLRANLTAKLRDAEVELSINRAKLDQRLAQLERQQAELERREKSLESKNSDGTSQKSGVLDRLSRHIGAHKQSDSR